MDELIKEYLKKHLTIEIDTKYPSYEDHKLVVTLKIDDEKICSDYIPFSHLGLDD